MGARRRGLGTMAAATTVAAGLALIGCSSGSGSSSPSPTTAAVAAAEVADGLRAAVADVVDELHVPGALVLVDTPEGRVVESFGNRAVGLAAPLTADDHYRIGSVTKTMTATVVLQLVEEGLVSLDDPVSAHLDGVPGGEQVSVRQLLNMTSGLPEFTDTDQMSDVIAADPGRTWSPQDALAIAFDPAATRPPGTEEPVRGAYHYDNTNYVLLGLLIEELTGQTASEAMHERIFEPLGMEHSFLPEPADAALPEPHPQGYVFGLGDDPDVAVDATDWNPSWAWTAGGVVSTLEDMAVYAAALADGRLLGPEMQAVRLNEDFVPVGTDSDVAYGLGIVRADGFYGHSGGIFGFNNWTLHDPERDITVIVLATALSTPYDPMPARTLLEAVTTQLWDTVLVPAAPAPADTDGTGDGSDAG